VPGLFLFVQVCSYRRHHFYLDIASSCLAAARPLFLKVSKKI
jgi:hypothetical protein